MSLNLNDVSVPGPGELQSSPGASRRVLSWPESPSHQRAPSLGELHQELENEQEMQVVRPIATFVFESRAKLGIESSPQHDPATAAADTVTPDRERRAW